MHMGKFSIRKKKACTPKRIHTEILYIMFVALIVFVSAIYHNHLHFPIVDHVHEQGYIFLPC